MWHWGIRLIVYGRIRPLTSFTSQKLFITPSTIHKVPYRTSSGHSRPPLERLWGIRVAPINEKDLLRAPCHKTSELFELYF